ncbi:unnamed protein product [Spodoptera exigua]|nr:unnamed protein product [Spodoptera exigua]
MLPKKVSSQIKIWKNQEPEELTPSAPYEDNLRALVPVNLQITIDLELEGLLTGPLERNWMLRISVALIGALSHGSGLTTHAIMQVGMDLEKFLTPKLNHIGATSFGTLPRAMVKTVYKVFTCCGVIPPPRYRFRQQMGEHSMLTGKGGATAFLQLNASIELDSFDLSLRDKALLKGFRQIFQIDPLVTDLPPPTLPHPGSMNPSVIFRHIVMGDYDKPKVAVQSQERKLLGIWGELRNKMKMKIKSPEDSAQEGGCNPCSGPFAMPYVHQDNQDSHQAGTSKVHSKIPRKKQDPQDPN